jgi:thiol-disulfide isomerase/thioredoxin
MWLASLLLALAIMVVGASQAHAAGWSMTDTQGKSHTLAGYKGKWVLVNFWATWCPPCLEEIPDLVALSEGNTKRLVVIGIAMDYKSAKQVTDFADGLMVSYPIVLGSNQIVSQIAPVDGLPTTYLYNPQGKLVAHQTGPITRKAIETFMNAKPAAL